MNRCIDALTLDFFLGIYKRGGQEIKLAVQIRPQNLNVIEVMLHDIRNLQINLFIPIKTGNMIMNENENNDIIIFNCIEDYSRIGNTD